LDLVVAPKEKVRKQVKTLRNTEGAILVINDVKAGKSTG
jgi:hypothetical protein